MEYWFKWKYSDSPGKNMQRHYQGKDLPSEGHVGIQ